MEFICMIETVKCLRFHESLPSFSSSPSLLELPIWLQTTLVSHLPLPSLNVHTWPPNQVAPCTSFSCLKAQNSRPHSLSSDVCSHQWGYYTLKMMKLMMTFDLHQTLEVQTGLVQPVAAYWTMLFCDEFHIVALFHPFGTCHCKTPIGLLQPYESPMHDKTCREFTICLAVWKEYIISSKY